MKIINKNTITCEEEKINTLSERFILEAMDHPFIVKLHYAFQSERKLYLLCDLMSGVRIPSYRASSFTFYDAAKSFPRRWLSSTPARFSWPSSTCTLATSSIVT
jgi:serine/threonine protein kinase